MLARTFLCLCLFVALCLSFCCSLHKKTGIFFCELLIRQYVSFNYIYLSYNYFYCYCSLLPSLQYTKFEKYFSVVAMEMRSGSLPPSSCDTFVALPPATKNGTIIFGKNSDRPAGEVQEVVYHPAADYGPGTKLQVKTPSSRNCRLDLWYFWLLLWNWEWFYKIFEGEL